MWHNVFITFAFFKYFCKHIYNILLINYGLLKKHADIVIEIFKNLNYEFQFKDKMR